MQRDPPRTTSSASGSGRPLRVTAMMRAPNPRSRTAISRPMLPKPTTATVASCSVPIAVAPDWSQRCCSALRTASGSRRTSASSSVTACSATVGAYASPAVVTVTPARDAVQLDGVVAHRRQLHPAQPRPVPREQRHELGVVERRPRPQRVGIGELAPHGVGVGDGHRLDAVAGGERLELGGEDVGSDHDAHPGPRSPRAAAASRARFRTVRAPPRDGGDGRGTVDAVMGRNVMTTDLAAAAHALVSGGRGLLSLDTAANAYRDLPITAPGIERYVGGMVLDEATIRRSARGGRRVVDVLRDRGILPGVSVGLGDGLSTLPWRLAEYAALGAGFATCRATLRIESGVGAPADRTMASNAHALARFAALCQATGIVPVVACDVLAEGDHSLARCEDATTRVLRTTFAALADERRRARRDGARREHGDAGAGVVAARRRRRRRRRDAAGVGRDGSRRGRRRRVPRRRARRAHRDRTAVRAQQDDAAPPPLAADVRVRPRDGAHARSRCCTACAAAAWPRAAPTRRRSKTSTSTATRIPGIAA